MKDSDSFFASIGVVMMVSFAILLFGSFYGAILHSASRRVLFLRLNSGRAPAPLSAAERELAILPVAAPPYAMIISLHYRSIAAAHMYHRCCEHNNYYTAR